MFGFFRLFLKADYPLAFINLKNTEAAGIGFIDGNGRDR